MVNKKKRVLDVARNLFTANGYKKVTMDVIAYQSGVTKKTIYSYFNDKDQLIGELILEKVAELNLIVKEVNKKNISNESKMHEIIYNLLNYRKEDRLLRNLSIEAKKLPFGIAKKWSDYVDTKVLNEIKSILSQAMNDGFIKKYDIDLLSFIIYKVYFSLIIERKEELSKKQISEIIDFLNSGLIRGNKDE